MARSELCSFFFFFPSKGSIIIEKANNEFVGRTKLLLRLKLGSNAWHTHSFNAINSPHDPRRKTTSQLPTSSSPDSPVRSPFTSARIHLVPALNLGVHYFPPASNIDDGACSLLKRVIFIEFCTAGPLLRCFAFEAIAAFFDIVVLDIPTMTQL